MATELSLPLLTKGIPMVKNDTVRGMRMFDPPPTLGKARTPQSGLVAMVKKLISGWLVQEPCFRDHRFLRQNPVQGKMLRTHLVQRLCDANGRDVDMDALAYACAAVELVHVATLFHDDVIDVAEVRRGEPALWRQASASTSILVGDLFLCRAINFLSLKGNVKLIGLFIEKMHETCAAEIRQELMLRGKTLPEKDCLQIARGKTGPLFAFCAALCSRGDRRLEAALEEAGYLIGTAYQLADDLIDEKGDCTKCGKTLGTDRLRKKYTLACINSGREGHVKGLIDSLCASAADLLAPWPLMHSGLQMYLEHDLYPVIFS
jgi:geranylgeranyl pyrophosphate synthase